MAIRSMCSSKITAGVASVTSPFQLSPLEMLFYVVIGEIAFHEKAGRSQVSLLFF